MNPIQCPECGHPPLRHVRDGLRSTCLVCMFEMREALHKAASGIILQTTRFKKICTRNFEFKIRGRERELAVKADKESYPRHTVCILCGCEWQQHMGFLCPSGDSIFVPLLETDPGRGVIGDS